MYGRLHLPESRVTVTADKSDRQQLFSARCLILKINYIYGVVKTKTQL